LDSEEAEVGGVSSAGDALGSSAAVSLVDPSAGFWAPPQPKRRNIDTARTTRIGGLLEKRHPQCTQIGRGVYP
jgi:hypothetical protein